MSEDLEAPTRPLKSFNQRFWAYPDGQDAAGKMMVANTYAMIGGLIISTYDVVMLSKPQGIGNIMVRYGYNTIPIMGMASAFTMGTYTATKLRGKDDPYNYAIGGALAGGVFGAWRKCAVTGNCMAIALAIAAVVKKLSLMEGWTFFPPPQKFGYQNLFMGRHDRTLMKDTEKGWTTGRE
ncbi:NADH dehydrogenase [ubiquinone] 1 alpha subcomplex subunit 11 [Phlebotomus argentipes]|uniref:NADH dehydrogenase [ubiquinone] 1 alpha subcomplex subunit 11 n=1 Tax=Phlebotomus argentipes TaxID=94469 RepID=UPI002892DF3A|nr:NADH dehydrogenase [ubiquinone] 1 alpha subcomplex subunit 11 [Phlebotomus argentipes]